MCFTQRIDMQLNEDETVNFSKITITNGDQTRLVSTVAEVPRKESMVVAFVEDLRAPVPSE